MQHMHFFINLIITIIILFLECLTKCYECSDATTCLNCAIGSNLNINSNCITCIVGAYYLNATNNICYCNFFFFFS